MRRFIASALILFALHLIPFAAQAESTDVDQFKLDLIMAKRGDFDAQFSVGAAYEYGRGVKRDLKQAFYWYKKAASNGHHRAQFKVGEFYEHGKGGVKQDLRNARIWYRLATLGNVREARARLQRLESPAVAAKAAPKTAPPRATSRTRPQTAKARPHPKPKPKPASRPRKPTPPTRIARAPAKPAPPRRPPAPRYDPAAIPGIIQAGKWQGRQVPNLILPTGSRCLHSGKTKIICFSPKQRLTVGNTEYVFITKSTLADFQPDGRFTVSYLFNVSDMKPASRPRPGPNPFGLRAEKGWQEPVRRLSCQLLRKDRIVCQHDGERLTFTSR